MTQLRKQRLMRLSLMQAKRKKVFSWGSKTLKYLVLLFWFLISIFPFVWALIASLTTPEKIPAMGINPISGAQNFTTDNYHYLFASDFTKTYLKTWIINGMIFSVGVATLNIFFNFLCGYGLSRISFKGKNLILWYFILGMMIPAQITQIPQLFILIKMGIISADTDNTIWFMGIIFTSMTSASWIFLVRQHYINMGTSAEEAGSIDGLSTIGIFFRISLKVMIPLMATQWAMIFMAAWNNFIMFTLWASGIPDRMTIVSALQVVGSAASSISPQLATAVTLAATNIAAIPVFVIYFVSLYFQKKGIAVADK